MTDVRPKALLDGVQDEFTRLHASEPRVCLAPGRVNLIGEHTDYNDGFVLPVAIDRSVVVAYGGRDDHHIVARARSVDGDSVISLPVVDRGEYSGWPAYVAGVAWAMQGDGVTLSGANLIIDGDVPIGAGLSSSAALGLAVARAFTDLCGVEWRPLDAARMVRRAENAFVGVACGIMDPLASAASRAGHAMLLDCRSLDMESILLPTDAAIVVMDTATRRELAASAYNERRASCVRAVTSVARVFQGISALRDVTVEQLSDARVGLDDVTYRRAKHVVEENARTLHCARTLQAGDLHAAGRLMNESHESIRDLFEASSPELDAITECARAHPACFGARMTGAGFGGCAIALTERDRLADFILHVETEYRARTGMRGTVFSVEPAAGAHIAA